MSEQATVDPATTDEVLGKHPRIKKEVRTLRHKFSAKERSDMTDQLCDKLAESDQIEKCKKESNDEFKSQASAIDAQIGRLRQQIVSGFEERPVDCEVHYHCPEQGKKRIVRMDSMEELEVLDMTQAECQETMDFNDEPEDDYDEPEASIDEEDELEEGDS